MKKLLLSSLFSLSTILAFGQLDLAITQIVAPSPGDTVSNLEQVTSRFVIQNAGTTTLNSGDTIFFRNELDGNTQTYSSGGSNFNVFLYRLSKTLAPTDTVLVSITLPVALNNNAVPAGSAFTWGFNVRGTTCCPTLDDANVSNNVMSVSLYASATIGVEELAGTSTDVYFSENLLHVEGNFAAGDATVEVYNLMGQKVFEGRINKGTTMEERFDLSHLASGVYVVTVSNEKQVITSQKIMK